MKSVTSSLTIKQLADPVLVQVIRSMRKRDLFRKKNLLLLLAIARFEDQGAFSEPATYLIVVHKYAHYEMFKYVSGVSLDRTNAPPAESDARTS